MTVRRLYALWRGGSLALFGAAIVSCAANAQPGTPRPLDPGEQIVELGPTKAQRDSNAPVLEFPFVARADEALTGAHVRVSFESSDVGLPRSRDAFAACSLARREFSSSAATSPSATAR